MKKTDLEKVQKTLSDVFTHFSNLNDTEYNRVMLADIGDACRIIESIKKVRGLGRSEMLDVLLHNRGYITSTEYTLTDEDLAKKVTDYLERQV